jgi:hypothetical protein
MAAAMIAEIRRKADRNETKWVEENMVSLNRTKGKSW